MVGNAAPVRTNHLSRTEGLVTIATYYQRCPVIQHFLLYCRSQSANCRSVPACHLLQMRKECPRRCQVGMGAFVERAVLIAEAAWDHPPHAGKELEVNERLKAPHGRIGWYLSLSQIQNCRLMGGYDGHLTMGDVGNRNSARRRFVNCRLTVGPSRDRRQK